MVMTSSESSTLIKQKSREPGMAEHVLPGHITVSRELRHLLGIEDLSLVRIQNVSYGPSDIKGIILHPFGDTEQEVKHKTCSGITGGYSYSVGSQLKAHYFPF